MGHATTMLPGLLLALSLHLAARERRRSPWRWPRALLLVLVLQCALFLFVPGTRFATSLRQYDSEWGRAIEAAQRFDSATTLVVVTGRSNSRAYRLPPVHLRPYDHDEADLQLEQNRESIEVRRPLQRLVLLDRGLVLTPPSLPGVRTEELIPGRLQLIEVPIPEAGLRVGRREVNLLEAQSPSEMSR